MPARAATTKVVAKRVISEIFYFGKNKKFCGGAEQPAPTFVLFTSAARTRMRLVVYLGEMLKIKVSIDLRRADIGVPE
jgi:hypothetical protein